MAGNRKRQGEAPTWHEYFRLQAEACTDPVLKRFYQAGVPAEDATIGDVSLMALDFETTGMDAQTHSIVSIGMVPFSLRAIRPAAGRHWVVKPSKALLEESVAFHRITHSEVERAPELDTVLDDVLDALAGHLVVVHYRDIERPFLDRAVMARRGEHCLFPLIDTMAIEARWEREGRLSRIKSFLGIKPPSIRLSESRARYGLPAYSAHHAKLDAMATAELFQAQVARHYSPETPVSSLWV
jgi:DNA polymerase III subunit epsilon